MLLLTKILREFFPTKKAFKGCALYVYPASLTKTKHLTNSARFYFLGMKE
jgi:hypothetical protein